MSGVEPERTTPVAALQLAYIAMNHLAERIVHRGSAVGASITRQ